MNWPTAAEDPISASLALGLLAHTGTSELLHVSWDLSSGPHDCVVSVLSAKLSP